MENIETLLAAVAQTQGFDDDDDPPPDTNSSTLGFQSSPVTPVEMTALQPTGTSPEGDDWPSLEVYPLPLAAVPTIGSGEKRKRGRPASGQLVAKPPLRKRKKVEDEEEDVCFICFDGGTLVLCDRKGCPKAYHPACIKRDEAFFNTDAKWNCGWHICSVCRKSSHYMCYMCTYSLCKGCTKGVDYVSVRGNKGFCSTCMKTIMLFENKDQANNESVKVDFDDKLSWEYLFKVYWVILKEKLSLTLSELTRAKNPWKGGSAVASKPHSGTVIHTAFDRKVSISSRTPDLLELNKPYEAVSFPQNDKSKQEAHVETKNRIKVKNVSNYSKEAETPSMENSNALPSIHTGSDEPCIDKATYKPCIKKDEDNPIVIENANNPCICKKKDEPRDKDPEKAGILNSTEWASKDLLEFVAHMKYGDTSALLQFDVQRLLLDYIKRKNLRDPRQKSQIICDQRLTNLFGKERVGHIEMLKLLEFHFPVKEDVQMNSFIPAGLVGFSSTDMGIDGNNNGSAMPVKGRKRMRKKGKERAAQNNLNEYAAINVHNINLIYLRHNLMENLIGDSGNFIDKVVGSIVRIKISSNDQKPDIHRLVQVVGTSKVSEPYKIGDKTSDIMLEVLNLDKKEAVSIDSISNQEFSEDECRRLRQSIRCGLMKQITVGELQKKAMALQPVKINNWLEAEILRLNHLRDRASEKGRKKELREYVNRLQQLKSSEERQRRILEVPKIHTDSKMSPDFESDEDLRKVDNSRKDEYLRPIGPGFARNGRKPVSSIKKGKGEASIQTHNRIMKKKIDADGSRCLEKHINQVNVSNSAGIDQAMQRSGLETSTAAAPVGNSPCSTNIETEKLWHYRDPNGKIQGPFAMMQLRKWSTTGLFPLDMRIWTNYEQYDSLPLTDALTAKFHATSELSHNFPSETEKHPVEGKAGSEGMIRIGEEIKQTKAASSNKAIDLPNRVVGADETGSCSSSWPQCWDLLKDNNSGVVDVQEHIVLPSSDQNSDRVPENNDSNHVTQNGEKKLIGPNQNEIIISAPNQNEIISGHELQNQSDNQGQAVPSSKENITLSIDLMNSNKHVPVLSPAVDAIKQDDLHNPTPKSSDGHLEVQPADNQKSLFSDVPFQTSGILELLSPTPRSKSENQDQGIEIKQSGPIDLSVPIDLSEPIDLSVPVDLSVPDGSTTWTSLVMGAEIPEVADEWCGYSPTCTKPPVQEWDLGIAASESSMGPPPEVTNENIATSTPNNNYNNEYTSWLAMLNEPREFDDLGEESVSDLLAEVDAMESQGTGFASPKSAIKFAKELLLDCKDDCFSSIEEFSSTHDPVKSDSYSATESSVPANQAEIHAFDFFNTSIVNSSTSSEGETSAPVSVSDFHHSVANNTGQDMVDVGMGPDTGSEPTDPGWGPVQGNINLVTVQGNVNLVLGGPGQGMTNLGWGTNPGTAWTNPNMNPSPRNGNCLPWENGQRNYSGEMFGSPREWGAYQGGDAGFGRGRPPHGRQSYGGGGGGYSRAPPKGQRVCKFYESGRCKKGAFCDYLHP